VKAIPYSSDTKTQRGRWTHHIFSQRKDAKAQRLKNNSLRLCVFALNYLPPPAHAQAQAQPAQAHAHPPPPPPPPPLPPELAMAFPIALSIDPKFRIPPFCPSSVPTAPEAVF
jgi:hypothetical protein